MILDPKYPASYWAEQLTLFCALVEPDTVSQVIPILGRDGSRFSIRENADIWESIIRLRDDGVPIDPFLVWQKTLETNPKLRPSRICEIAGTDMTPMPEYAVHYARKIVEHAREREQARILETCRRNPRLDLELELDKLKAFDTTQTGSVIHGDAFAAFAEEHLNIIISLDGKPQGIPAGFPVLDDAIKGWHYGDMHLIAARTSVGKTAFGLNAAIAAAKSGYPVLIFSCEMTKERIAERMAGILGGANIQLLKQGGTDQFAEANKTRALDGIRKLRSMNNLALDTNANFELGRIVQTATEFVKKNGIALIVIDYIQRIKERSNKDRRLQMEFITGELQQLAKQLNSPILCLAQLRRDAEKIHDPRALMACLKESGALEEDADIVIVLQRPEGADLDALAREKNVSDPMKHKLMRVLIAKNRHGGTSPVACFFDPETQRFSRIHETDGKGFEFSPYRDVTESKPREVAFNGQLFDGDPGYDDGDNDLPF